MALETMRRVRHDAATIADNLAISGYEFHRPDEITVDPSPNLTDQLSEIERRIGKVPLSFRSFYEIVGSVDLAAMHREWSGCEYPDPLVVDPISSATDELEDWALAPEEYEPSSGSLRVPIASDPKHKENVSGAMWYGMALPNAGADGVVLAEAHNLPFVEYLRLCLHWGGFPGLEGTQHNWPLEQLRAGSLER